MAHTTAQHHIDHHVRRYVLVFVALLGLTIVTVTVSYLHLGVAAAVAVALFIATIKGSLVASYFMHLISEKKAIMIMLVLTVFFFAGLMALPLFSYADQVMTPHVP